MDLNLAGLIQVITSPGLTAMIYFLQENSIHCVHFGGTELAYDSEMRILVTHALGLEFSVRRDDA